MISVSLADLRNEPVVEYAIKLLGNASIECGFDRTCRKVFDLLGLGNRLDWAAERQQSGRPSRGPHICKVHWP